MLVRVGPVVEGRALVARVDVLRPRHPVGLHEGARRVSGKKLSVFWIFSIIKKRIFSYFIKIVWLGVGFLNRTGADIGY